MGDRLAEGCVRGGATSPRRTFGCDDRESVARALRFCDVLNMTYRDAEKARLITPMHAALIRDYLDQPYLASLGDLAM
jgi:hypothetical protein